MSTPTGLFERNGHYYLRFIIPTHQRHLFNGRTRIVQSLNTRQKRQACKKRKLTDAQLEEAIKLRESGFAWRMLGDRYGVNHDTLRLAVRSKGTKCHIGR